MTNSLYVACHRRFMLKSTSFLKNIKTPAK
jgi:hypothetical protein